MAMKHFHENMRERYEPLVFQSVRETMKHGDLVYDIGAYDGITSAIIAEIVGPRNVVIIEPAEMNWATIKAYWEAHKFGAIPRATYSGFLSDSDKPGIDPAVLVYTDRFPPEADTHAISQNEEGLNFRLLDDRSKYPVVAARPWLTLDHLARLAGRPTGIVMDVEGAELVVLKGAKDTLRWSCPTLWIEVHTRFMKERFGHSPEELFKFLADLGYEKTFLGSPINEHWKFTYKEQQ
jgi:FkbM family methyltransferase